MAKACRLLLRDQCFAGISKPSITCLLIRFRPRELVCPMARLGLDGAVRLQLRSDPCACRQNLRPASFYTTKSDYWIDLYSNNPDQYQKVKTNARKSSTSWNKKPVD
jgi:hypothetical protein